MCTFIGTSVVFVSCGDDEVEPNGGGNSGKNAEQNTTDVAVTGSVSELSAFWAQINGVVNLEVITASYTNVTIGVEVSTTEDFKDKERTKASDVVGRKFSVRVFLGYPDTKYYYRTYVSVSSLSYDYYGETYSFVTKPLDNSNHYVDLGLPSGTLWATMNVGASKPEYYGDYFAWGETEPYNENGKSTFNWSTYKWCNGSFSTLTKYNTYSSYGTVDNKTELDLEDDAAYVNWGSSWRMPSKQQFDELINSSYTTTEWTSVNGIGGRLITSKTNGNSIFLPAAGCRGGTSLLTAGSYGNYWSRTLYSSDSSDARDLNFNSGSIYTYSSSRYDGQSVRPVRLSE